MSNKTNRIISLLFQFQLIFCFTLFGQNINTEEIQTIKEIVYALSHDSMMGRAAGSEGEEKAKNYIIRYFSAKGIPGLNQSYQHPFRFPKDSLTSDTATNILAFINNNADSTIILGAHYDHIGFGGAKSRSFTHKKIHHGADDNASGVALLLHIAEKLKTNNYQKFNYLFIAFSAHEEGLYGSQSFINEKIFEMSNVKFVLNFDMVGRLDINPVVKVIRNENDNFLDSVFYSAEPDKFQLKITSDNFQLTDAYAFSRTNIPSFTFSTGTHDDYHKTSDTAEKINYFGIAYLSKFIQDLVALY